jgi:hypothetical protein
MFTASAETEYAEYREALLNGDIEPQPVECIEVGCTVMLPKASVAKGYEKCYECRKYDDKEDAAKAFDEDPDNNVY